MKIRQELLEQYAREKPDYYQDAVLKLSKHTSMGIPLKTSVENFQSQVEAQSQYAAQNPIPYQRDVCEPDVYTQSGLNSGLSGYPNEIFSDEDLVSYGKQTAFICSTLPSMAKEDKE